MPTPPPANGGSVQQGLSAAYVLFAFCLQRLAADKRYSLAGKSDMAFLFSLLLPLLTCVVLVGATAVVWRDVLPSVWSYVGLALLVVLGLHCVLQVGAEIVTLFRASGYFLEYQKPPNIVDMTEHTFTLEAVVISLLIVALSWPLLSWLRNLLTR